MKKNKIILTILALSVTGLSLSADKKPEKLSPASSASTSSTASASTSSTVPANDNMAVDNVSTRLLNLSLSASAGSAGSATSSTSVTAAATASISAMVGQTATDESKSSNSSSSTSASSTAVVNSVSTLVSIPGHGIFRLTKDSNGNKTIQFLFPENHIFG